VVSSENEKVIRIFDFKAKKKYKALNAHASSIYVVSQKKVISVGRKTRSAENGKKIVKMTINTTYLNMKVPTTLTGTNS